MTYDVIARSHRLGTEAHLTVEARDELEAYLAAHAISPTVYGCSDEAREALTTVHVVEVPTGDVLRGLLIACAMAAAIWALLIVFCLVVF